MRARKTLSRGSAKPARNANKKFLVYFEGEETERLYVNGLRKLALSFGIVIEPGPSYGEPLGLVKSARKRAREISKADPYDAVWCIFDVEAPTPHGGLDAALRLAKQSNILCAMSNPCFELWLVLHVSEFAGYRTTAEMCRIAKSRISSYDSKSFDFEEVSSRIGAAVERARNLDEQYPDYVHRKEKNPSSSMWKLIEFLCENGLALSE
ncbi:RloB family protein [Streptomyces sp. NPDC047108]|uniref:RloB family protein n=1 Tax=Streptomyces sp. NPDC047108 TaxID=3155025 RepID=UPI0033C3D03D